MCDENMWMTMGRERMCTKQDLLDSVKEWVDQVMSSINQSDNRPLGPEPAAGPDRLKMPSSGSTNLQWKSQFLKSCFSRPRVRSRLERLMGSDEIVITDRAYMQSLQEQIREDHEECLRKRIHEREVGEIEREKRLVLDGKIPVEEAPKELADHPVFKITQLTKKILEERRMKAEAMRAPKPFHGYHYDVLRKLTTENILFTKDNAEGEIVLDEEEIAKIEHLRNIEIEIESGNLFTEEDCDLYKYENPLVKKLRKVEDVNEMYKIAELIIGPVKSIRC